jgi:uncharacterized protein GlcG (DUF336 family)
MRRRDRARGGALRRGEQLEDRFFLGQLTLPQIDEGNLEAADEAQLDHPDADVAVPNAHEEQAQALESVFRDLSLLMLSDIPPETPLPSEKQISFVPRTQRQTPQPDQSDSASDFEFSSISDVAHADLLLESLRTGEPLALSSDDRAERKAEKKLARTEKKSGSDSTDPPTGLVTQSSGSSSGSSDSGTSATGPSSSSSNSAGITGNSGIGAGNLGSPTTTGTAGGDSSSSSSSLNQVLSTLGASSGSINSGSGTASNGQTYLAGSGTSSKPDVLANLVGNPQLSTTDVQTLLQRASEATPSNDAIIAVVDRQGNILGVRTESGVPITDTATLVFAIDGAVAEARTAAFFSSDQGALTSRTVQFISQSTITQREVESNPSITDMTSTSAGPGFVAPIGIGGHFPPGITAAPTVDLFGIENTNRDSTDSYADGGGRFDAMYIAGQEIDAPGSYGLQSGLDPTAQPRGIATLPGGIPLYRDTGDADSVGDTLVGGIGVFFPGTTGYATFEQGFVAGDGKSTTSRINSQKALEAEFIAFVAAGGSRGAGIPIGTIAGTPAVAGLDLPFGQINLGGITLQGVGPTAGIEGAKQLKNKFIGVLGTGANSGTDQMVTPAAQYLAGEAVPSGWLVAPHAAADGSLAAADVTQIIQQGITEANKTRAAIREFPTLGQRTKMVFAVTDKTGAVLGLYRMPDSTYFSVDVAVAKARNVAYYDDPTKLQAVDKISNIPAGTAFTSRTFRFLAEPRFPSGVDGSKPPAFSILNEVNPTTHLPLFNKKTGENIGAAAPADWFRTVFGYDAFNIGTNFRDTSTSSDLQNGVVFFPGSTALYKNGKLVGGLGVSGDGVDQDDGVTSAASTGFTAPSAIRADRYSVNGVRLPYFKFVRNPYG